jgi:hypothetical protein
MFTQFLKKVLHCNGQELSCSYKVGAGALIFSVLEAAAIACLSLVLRHHESR